MFDIVNRVLKPAGALQLMPGIFREVLDGKNEYAAGPENAPGFGKYFLQRADVNENVGSNQQINRNRVQRRQIAFDVAFDQVVINTTPVRMIQHPRAGIDTREMAHTRCNLDTAQTSAATEIDGDQLIGRCAVEGAHLRANQRRQGIAKRLRKVVIKSSRIVVKNRPHIPNRRLIARLSGYRLQQVVEQVLVKAIFQCASIQLAGRFKVSAGIEQPSQIEVGLGQMWIEANCAPVVVGGFLNLSHRVIGGAAIVKRLDVVRPGCDCERVFCDCLMEVSELLEKIGKPVIAGCRSGIQIKGRAEKSFRFFVLPKIDISLRIVEQVRRILRRVIERKGEVIARLVQVACFEQCQPF